MCESYTGTRTRPGVVCCASVAATHRTVTCVPAGPRWEGGGRCRCSLFAQLPFPWRVHPEPFGTERQSSFTTEGFSRARRVLRVVPGAVGSAGGGARGGRARRVWLAGQPGREQQHPKTEGAGTEEQSACCGKAGRGWPRFRVCTLSTEAERKLGVSKNDKPTTGFQPEPSEASNTE